MRYLNYITENYNDSTVWNDQSKIDTGIPITSTNMSVRIKYNEKFDNHNTTYCARIAGYYEIIDYPYFGGGFCIGGMNGGYFRCGQHSGMSLDIAEQNVWYDITFGTTYVYDNQNNVYIHQYSSPTTPDPVGTNIFVDVNWTKVNEVIIYDGETVVFDGKAAIDDNGHIGLWDEISQTLKYNPDLLMTYEAIVVDNPLCFTAKQDNSIIQMGGQNQPVIYYSYDNDNWTLWDYSPIVLNNEESVYMYGENEVFNGEAEFNYFGITGRIWASGDLTTLLNPNGTDTLPDFCFNALFGGCSGLEKAPELTATNLGYRCYKAIFSYCTNLVDVTVNGNITEENSKWWLDGVNIQEAGIVYSRENLDTSLVPRGFAVFSSKDTFNYTYDNRNGRAVYAFNGNFPYTDTLVGAIYVEEDESSLILIYCSQNGLHLDSSEWNTQYGTIDNVITQFDNRQMFISVRIFEGYHMRVEGSYSERTPDPTITGTDNTSQCWDGSTIHTGTGTVTITDPSPEALIKYSINNGEWIDYSTPIQLSTGEYTIKSYATQSGYNPSRTVTYQLTVSEAEECPQKHTNIVSKLTTILDAMVNDEYCELASFQYNSIAKGNVRLDNKMPNPTSLLVQITDWSLDLTNMTKREAVEVSLFFLDKETKIDNEALAQDVIVKNMADIACDFLSRLMADKSLKIVDEKVKIKSVFYQSDSNRDGVCLQMRIEEKGGSCL